MPARLTLKLRHGPKLISATVRSLRDNGKEKLGIEMDESDRGLAPGQFAVLYDGEICLGGAMIEG
jgi:tRNA-specific 2-thiouridylase